MNKRFCKTNGIKIHYSKLKIQNENENENEKSKSSLNMK
jgi:hypothetical protein